MTWLKKEQARRKPAASWNLCCVLDDDDDVAELKEKRHIKDHI